MGALAFVNSDQAYAAVGPICTLPIRPFWYRLALSWIPRYLVVIYICYVALRIYTHVGKEFKVFGQVDDESNSFDMPGESSCLRADANLALTMRSMNTTSGNEDRVATEKDEIRMAPRNLSMPTLQRASWAKQQHTIASLSNDDSRSAFPGSLPGSRRPSLIAWTDFSMAQDPRPTKSLPGSRRASRQGPINMAQVSQATAPLDQSVALEIRDFTERRNSVDTLASLRSPGKPQQNAGAAIAISNPAPQQSAPPDLANAQRTAMELIQGRRRAIQRQLRILFIYPVVYFFLWIFPLVAHCLSYNDRFAQHPVFAISILNFFCQSFLGCADVLVFSWREKPWRHIPGSDGTFTGSFRFWSFHDAQGWTEHDQLPTTKPPPRDVLVTPAQSESQTIHSRTTLLTSIKDWSTIRTSPPPSSPSASSFATAPTRPSATRSKPHSIFARAAQSRRSGASASDRRQLEFERAHERLELERRQHAQRAEQALSSRPTVGARERREWWDAGGTGDLFRDDSDDDHDGALKRADRHNNHNHSNDDNEIDDDDDDDDESKYRRASARTEKASSRTTSGASEAEKVHEELEEKQEEKESSLFEPPPTTTTASTTNAAAATTAVASKSPVEKENG
nr:g protein-coupled receptor gpr1 [Quercus suber]